METFKWITKSIALQFFSKTKEFKVSRLKTLLWKIKKKKNEEFIINYNKTTWSIFKKINYQFLIKSISISSKKILSISTKSSNVSKS